VAEEAFTLSVLSPVGSVFKGQVRSVTLPTPDGEITVLARHMPLVAVLADGEMHALTDGGTVSIAVAGGFLEAGAHGATVLSDFAAEAESIDAARVEAAKKRAEQLLGEKKERRELALVERDLQHLVLQLKVAEKARRRQKKVEGAS
jgi:F-type H+-transporting ATPase subunit epsilon